MTRALSIGLLLLVWSAGCSGDNPALGPAEPAAQEALRCAPFTSVAGAPLSLERARAEHRWVELRRHVRMMEALEPRFLLDRTAQVVQPARVVEGDTIRCGDLLTVGRLVFEHEYTFADGLQPFQRVQTGELGGPETQSCRSCHWRGGPAGAGAILDNTFLLGDGDRVSSADPRNPPPLLGLGLVQLLADEMTADLHAQRDAAQAEALQGQLTLERPLRTKGVSFGRIRVAPDGAVDTSEVEGVDPDLVVKPFGWKGNFATLRDFARGAVADHLGVTTDHDGADLTEGQVSALLVYLATLSPPTTRIPEPARDLPSPADPLLPPAEFDFSDDWARGHQLFEAIGCAQCHRRTLVLQSPLLRLSPGSPTSRPITIDLSEDVEPPLLRHDAALGGYPVHLFSDLKRHDLGDTQTQHAHRGVAAEQYMTRRLWGLNGSAPYLHDGSAPFLDHAIRAHDGEAAFARDGFEALDVRGQGDLRIYLMSLRRPWELMAVP